MLFEEINARVRVGVGKTPPRGRLVGALRPGEDLRGLEQSIIPARNRVLGGEATLLTHAEHLPADAELPRMNRVEPMLEALRQGRLKRYVFAVDTNAGRRIVKIAEPLGLGNRLEGLVGRSISRREHARQCEAELRDIAAATGCGFLEWRVGPTLIRSAHIQEPLHDHLQPLGIFLPAQLEQYGDAALDALAEALAEAHRVPFFHADLKLFHAFADEITAIEGAPRYTLRWLDLARSSFRLSRRQRVINLYQALRWVVPRRPEAEQRFVHAYCRAADWYAEAPDKGLQVVRRFLAHKLRTHQP